MERLTLNNLKGLFNSDEVQYSSLLEWINEDFDLTCGRNTITLKDKQGKLVDKFKLEVEEFGTWQCYFILNKNNKLINHTISEKYQYRQFKKFKDDNLMEVVKGIIYFIYINKMKYKYNEKIEIIEY